MKYAKTILISTAVATARFTPQAKIPIRAVTAPLATTSRSFKVVSDGSNRELADGRLLVNAGIDRELLIFDRSLTNATVLADTNGTAELYAFAPRVVPYLGDSTMMWDQQSRSLFLITPSGTMGRVMAPPTRSFNAFGPGGGADSKGRLVFSQLGGGPAAPPPACTPGGATAAPPAPPPDSAVIVRADFVTRTMDTVAKNRGPTFASPEVVRNAACDVVGVKWAFNPMLPQMDTWVMTSTGVLAIVRGFDYHVDFVYADGRKFSGPKLPFDWRRITDAEKQQKIDSARKVIDSLTAAGGYRARVCGGNIVGLLLSPPPPAAPGAPSGAVGGGGRGGGDVAVGRGGGGGGGEPPAASDVDCKWMPLTATFPALNDMPDYIPPIRQTVPKADVDGNVWILPTTSLAAKDGLLYDVVNPKGELIERVQLPKDRDIVAFGKDGALYLSRREAANKVFIERVTVIRK